jgi:hypothetical protein
MSDFFGKLKSGAGKVTFEADKMNRLNRAKGDLEKIKNQIQAQYLKLGEMYYSQRATMGVTGPAYDDICQAVVDLEHQIASKNEDLQRINAENYAPQGAQPAPQPAYPAQPQYTPTPAPTQYTPPPVPTQFPPPPNSTQFTPPPAPVQNAATTKFCPNCGKEMPAAAKFCPDCGTKM